MREKSEALVYGDGLNQLSELKKLLNDGSYDDYAKKEKLKNYFLHSNFCDESISQISKTVQKVDNQLFNRELVKFLKLKKASELVLELIAVGELNYSRSIARTLMNYCEEVKLYSPGLSFLWNIGTRVFSRSTFSSYENKFEILRGNLSKGQIKITSELFNTFLHMALDKNTWDLDRKIYDSALELESLQFILSKASPRSLGSLMFFFLGYLKSGDISEGKIDVIANIVKHIQVSDLVIYHSHEEEDLEKLIKIRELINKSKILSNLRRKDLLEKLLLDLRDIDENNAWLKYLRSGSSERISDVEREKIFNYYDELSLSVREPMKTRQIEKELREFLNSPDKIDLSDLYFTSYSLGLFPLCFDISEQIIKRSETSNELINGMVLRAKTYMAMGKWLKANDYIDQLFEELPIRSHEKRALLEMKIKCLDSLNFKNEAEENRAVLKRLES